MKFTHHPDREQIISETHARPFYPVTGPAKIFHIAFRTEKPVYQTYFQKLSQDTASPDARHLLGKIDGIAIKLEQHTEFMTCTLFHEQDKKKAPFDLIGFFQDNFPIEDIKVLTMQRVIVVNSAKDMYSVLWQEDRIYGGKLRGGRFVGGSFFLKKWQSCGVGNVAVEKVREIQGRDVYYRHKIYSLRI